MQLIYSTLLVLLIFSTGFETGNAELELPLFPDNDNMESLMAKAAGGIFRSIYESGAIPLGKAEIQGKDSMDTFATLPLPLPDPLVIGNLSLGSIALGNTALYGLSKSQLSVTINSTELMISLVVQVARLSTDGFYEAALMIPIGSTPINATGAGAHNITFHNFAVGLDLKVNIDLVSGNLTGISNVSVTIDFDGMDTVLENFALNGNPVDWADATNQGQFFGIVLGQIKNAKAAIDGMVQNLLNMVLQACPLAEVIGGDLSCLNPTQSSTSTGPTSTDASTDAETTTAGGVVGSTAMSILTTIVCFLTIFWH